MGRSSWSAGSNWRARALQKCARSTDDEAVNVRVPVLLRLVQAGTAGEDNVGAVDQLLLELEQLGRRELKLAELVHRVEHHHVGVEMPREGQHHRRVVPGDQRSAQRGHVSVEQALERGFTRILRHARGEMGHDNADVRRIAGLSNLQESRFP